MASADPISFARGAPSADILPAEAVREAAAQALESDWQRALSYGTGVGHTGLGEWIANLHGIEPEQVMVTNGSMEAAALLFQHSLEPGDRVIVEQPSYDRTLLLLGRAGVELVPVPLEADGVDVAARRGRARRRAGPLRPHHPQLPQPGRLHALGREAHAAGRAGRRARLHPVRGRPVPPRPLRRRRARDDARPGRRRARDPRLVVLEDGQPGRPRRLPGRRARGDRAARQARRARPTSRRTCWPSRSSSRSASRGGLERNIEFVNGALRDRRDALVEALGEHLPEADFVVPEGGYFLWLTLAEDVDSVALLRAAAEEGVSFVAGPDFLLEGGANALRLSFASVPAERVAGGRRAHRPRARGPARRPRRGIDCAKRRAGGQMRKALGGLAVVVAVAAVATATADSVELRNPGFETGNLNGLEDRWSKAAATGSSTRRASRTPNSTEVPPRGLPAPQGIPTPAAGQRAAIVTQEGQGSTSFTGCCARSRMRARTSSVSSSTTATSRAGASSTEQLRAIAGSKRSILPRGDRRPPNQQVRIDVLKRECRVKSLNGRRHPRDVLPHAQRGDPLRRRYADGCAST